MLSLFPQNLYWRRNSIKCRDSNKSYHPAKSLRNWQSLKYLIAPIILSLSLTACEIAQSPELSSQAISPSFPSSAEASLAKAANATSPFADALILHAVRLFNNEQRYAQAQHSLQTLYYSDLNNEMKADFLIQQSTIYLRTNKAANAIELLTNSSLGLETFFSSLKPEQQVAILMLRAETHEALENYITGARDRIFFGPLLSKDDDIQRNNDAIWLDLMTLSRGDLERLAEVPGNPDFNGWVELAIINKALLDNLDYQVGQINNWQAIWPAHPAQTHLPSALQALVSAAANQPQNIALLLPSSGKYKRAADIVRDGFMTAYYTAMLEGLKTPNLKFYDSAEVDILSLHQQAVADGAELIIGPLDKDKLRTLAQQSNLAVRTLALNYLEDAAELPPPLFQFGLAPKDEVAQIATRAQLYGYKNAAIIYPDTEWGHRVREAFVTVWNEMEGQVVAEVALDREQEFSTPIKSMLNIDESEARQKRLKSLFKENVEFEPRRRQDIDFILLLANPREGRQIKPTLSFHYAHNLPLFATSSIYSTKLEPEINKDLNNIYFIDIPWVLNEPDAIKQQSQQAWPQVSGVLERLHAMGVDAFRIYPRLAILQAVADGRIDGATGMLSLGENNRIQRQLLWAQMKKGKATLIPRHLDIE